MPFGRGEGLGTVQLMVLQAIGREPMDLATVTAMLKHRYSGPGVKQMLAGLLKRDYLTQIGGGRYALTAKGFATIQKAQTPFAMGRYVPPSYAPARLGAMDFARLPSVAAGVARPYWAEGVE